MIVVTFVIALTLIVVASELFTNAVEWAGFRLKLGTGATGSLLAAIGTALPEATVPVVALLTMVPNANAVAIGAVLGAPLLLLTLGVGITGLAVTLRRRQPVLNIDRRQAQRDLGVFVVAFSFSAIAAFLQFPLSVRVPLGIALLLGYGGYAWVTLRSPSAEESMPEPLHLIRWDASRQAGAVVISIQLIVAVALLIIGSELFVRGLDDMAAALHLDTLILAVLLVPIATELPETMNSVLWVRSNDDSLAFGNVAGSATFQACILGFIGVCFTTWRPGVSGLLSMGLTLVTAVYLLLVLRDGRARGWLLMLAAVPWICYVIIEIIAGGQWATAS